MKDCFSLALREENNSLIWQIPTPSFDSISLCIIHSKTAGLRGWWIMPCQENPLSINKEIFSILLAKEGLNVIYRIKDTDSHFSTILSMSLVGIKNFVIDGESLQKSVKDLKEKLPLDVCIGLKTSNVNNLPDADFYITGLKNYEIIKASKMPLMEKTIVDCFVEDLKKMDDLRLREVVGNLKGIAVKGKYKEIELLERRLKGEF